MWTESNPGKGDTNAIRRQAHLRTAKSAELEIVRQTLSRAQGLANSGEWQGLAKVAFVAKVDTFYPQLNGLISALDGTAHGLNVYAAAVEQIQLAQGAIEGQRRRITGELAQRVRQIVSINGTFGLNPLPPYRDLERIHPADTSEQVSQRGRLFAQVDSLQSELKANSAALAELVHRRRSADAVCVSRLNSLNSESLNPEHRAPSGIGLLSTPGLTQDATSFLAMIAAMDADDLAVLAAKYPQLLRTLAAAPAAAVAAWWQRLGGNAYGPLSSHELMLIAALAAVLGGLDGVPVLARIAANRLNAASRLEAASAELAALAQSDPDNKHALALLRAEVRYLHKAVDGTVQLYLYDKGRARIIEMIGTLSASTERIITYVPGTFSNLAGFYAGGTQQFSEWQTGQSVSGVVAFVYKDGRFPGGDEFSLPGEEPRLGLLEANRADWAALQGQKLAAFEKSLWLDPALSQRESAAIGHSWGLAAITASEMSGAHYDKVISLSGAWMPQGWAADPLTVYTDYSYLDSLQVAQRTNQVGEGNNPRTNDSFEHGDYYRSPGQPSSPPPGADYKTLAKYAGMLNANHNLVATDDDANLKLLRDVREEVLR